MSFENPQPGDTTPHDAPRPGDEAKLHERDQTRGGDASPHDHAITHDDQHVGDEPIGGVAFSAPFIRRPVATFLLSFAILIAGAVAYTLLPVASLPQVEYPVISVAAQLPGADPNTMASAVATPLERQFSRIAGVNQMTSSSSTGSTSIIMQFDLNRDVDGAARDVQAAINAARAQLPANMPSNPTYRKINPADSPILMLALTSDTASVAQMYDASDSILAQKIAQIDGVGQTFTGGSAKPAVRIEANPYMLSSFGLSMDDLRTALGTVNVLKPTGYLNGDGPDSQRMRVSSTDQLFGADAYAPIIIATNKGPVSSATAASGLPAAAASAVTSNTATKTTSSTATTAAKTTTTAAVQNFATSTPVSGAAAERGIVRVRDVATVTDGVEDIHTSGIFNGQPAILVVVFKSPGANVISTVDNILKILPQLQASIPPTMKLQIVLDRTATIRASIKDVTSTLIISILLVILVVFVFLREARSTLIPSVSVPLSLLGTMGVMYLLGYTLDNLSLMALTISTGFVVDDAIVVIENISRHLEEGLSPFEAAMKGSKEIGFTVLSMSISLVAVFIPILLMGGIVGRLFREFAVTLSTAILVSLVVSLTTTPMLSAKFLKPHNKAKKGWFYKTGERHLARLSNEYARGLRWVLDHQLITLGIFALTFILNIYLFIIVPKGFFPQQDTGRLSGRLQMQQDTSFDTLKGRLADVTNKVMKDPAVENVLGFAGAGGPGGGSSNTASFFVILKDSALRVKTGDTVDKVIARLRPTTANMPGTAFYLQASQELNIGGRSSATQYQYTLSADTVEDLDKWSPQLEKAMQQLPELKDVVTDQLEGGLESNLVIDRDTASRLGVTVLSIDSALSDAYGQRQVSTTYLALNQYHVVMEAAQPYQQSPEDIRTLFVKSSNGTQIPLSQLTTISTTRVPLSVNHQGLSPAATISFNLSTDVSLSQATVAIENARQKIGMPSTIIGGFQGSAQAFQASLSSEPILLGLAIFTVYIILGILYESFIHPLTILSTLPSAGVGAFLALILFKIDLSIIADIGIILLIGIVKKNAIMMVDFALVAEREHGKSPRDAIYEACLLRFRPIMMTTMAAILGAVPMAFGSGTGSELRRPLGVTIIGGLVVSQCLTLFTTPVIYLAFDWIRMMLPHLWSWFLGKGWTRTAVPATQPVHVPAD